MKIKPKRTADELLILFTRFPEPGQVKTRLIPALGSRKAAKLQRILTGVSIEEALDLSGRRGTLTELFFSGGDDNLMKQTFGLSMPLKLQKGSTLGEKLRQAFRESFARGITRVVIIGTDCPSLTSEIMESALLKLKDYDVVVGPAVDGGFYLIGMGEGYDDILEGIDWGSGQVLAQLTENIQKKSLAFTLMDYLRDIDDPEDLTALGPWIRRELT
ncbi:MAG: TIGR04282 family arsenosugar biosynthesis glycosyltransferase [Desulfurivibrionaceae bacterium]